MKKQKRIVKLLDNLSEVKNKKNEELKLCDTLIKARFVEMFGDPGLVHRENKVCNLENVAEVRSSHRIFTREFTKSGVPFYRGTEISLLANGKEPIHSYYISKARYDEITKNDSKPKIGDLLMPSICDKGQIWLVNTSKPFYYKDGRVLCISPNREKFNTIFFHQYMKMKSQIEYLKIGSGSTFAEFKIFQLKKLKINIPPLKLQNEFASFVQQVDKSKVAIQKSLDETQTLFDSLMQKYFS
ncbi:type I restriction-modification system subunit S [Lactobacillus amylovorus GRL 1112]|uniref:Type I restriction-modification system subunit S n=1 Tax=Lactobacillus amylovorus (strain GRL 1112) TaxID=695560 RepID=E4SL77_LACAR|nr:restriction endonuclease subunit S [Lactobacillus amylovorus]ADQ59544.1 type I restriction-modification system subunit S [Lactobacillus amylovorus GRL 1112]